MNISPARVFAGTATVAAVGIGAFLYAANSKASAPALAKRVAEVKRDPLIEAREGLAEQLQRRFHDRNDIDFGYGRIVREGARMHASATVNRNPDAEGMKKISADWEEHLGEDGWYDREGNWHKGEAREMFEAETAKEEAIVSVLRNGPATAIYTVGLEGADGEPKRVKGPAYLAPQGPKAITIYGAGATVASVEATKKKLARTAMSLKDGSSAVIDGWRFVSYDVKADGKDCLKCHRSAEYPMANKQATKLKVGDTIGRFLIATKEPSQVR